MSFNKVVVVGAKRTPIGSFMGSLSGTPATLIGAKSIESAIKSISLKTNLIDEVYFGNVLQAGVGQAPARQSAIFAGISKEVPCTTINKVCSSGLKSISIAAQSIALGDNNIVVAGGMENMSMSPHYLNLRRGVKFGGTRLNDVMETDGLMDPFHNKLMGVYAEATANKYKISREEQDKYCKESYLKSQNAWEKGFFNNEICEIKIKDSKGKEINFKRDEECFNVNFDKIKNLKSPFLKSGTVTAANASTISDGSAALILMSEKKAKELNLNPLAEITSYADAANDPKWFTTAPSKVLPIALKRANLNLSQIDLLEINEAFSVVALANLKILGINPDIVNVNGGAVSLGHPLGCSGARIVVTLIHALNQRNLKRGAAIICNGGGGASAIVIESIKE
ncbi:MAG: thiolase family protein [Flavobacteriaceae bacterium]|tara:strand:+ start:47019 stop:48206 length:1188 start_codon:yes stop_codon:yes gene_type:complete